MLSKKELWEHSLQLIGTCKQDINLSLSFVGILETKGSFLKVMTPMLSYGPCLKEEAMNFTLYTRDYGGIFVLNTMYIKMSSVS